MSVRGEANELSRKGVNAGCMLARVRERTDEVEDVYNKQCSLWRKERKGEHKASRQGPTSSNTEGSTYAGGLGDADPAGLTDFGATKPIGMLAPGRRSAQSPECPCQRIWWGVPALAFESFESAAVKTP